MGPDRSARDFWVRIAIAALSVIGIAITIYLEYERYHGNSPVCALGGGCQTVQQSEWSTVHGIPVALLGLAAYATLLVCALVPWQWAALVSLFITLMGVLLSIWLTYLELFQIHAVCEYCVTSAILVTILFVLSIVRLRQIGTAAATGPPAAPSA